MLICCYTVIGRGVSAIPARYGNGDRRQDSRAVAILSRYILTLFLDILHSNQNKIIKSLDLKIN